MKLNNSMALTKKQTSKNKWWGPIIWTILIFYFSIQIVQLVAPIIVSSLGNRTPLMLTLLGMSLFPVMFILVLLVNRYYYKRSLSSLGITGKEFIYKYLSGLGIGLILLLSVYVVNFAIGSLSTSVNNQIIWLEIFILFLAYVLQGFTEELLCRGFLMNLLSVKLGIWPAIIINSIIFTALHGMNNGITPLALINLTLAAMFFSLVFYLTNSLILVGAIHTAWNFLLGPVIGMAVSGGETSISVFQTVPDMQKSLYNGGDFGLEGGVIVTVILTMCCIMIYKMISKKNNMLHG
ncbi:CPBP family intramembrane glutamic endopeptidase [Vagococcus entomophilus]|uniref:CAAX prenyl protease 2/Lysostaphin resistance protein A-like domain-containing protein n=1 Tax=Vagococcus entomophilus TaxID=1160095 RepID=A0A430AJQ7_9ENTE|nr:type II CAAX endopeptidase family protein [Vagococcus entomophilus]RSU08342.1 hypothetical protein CBF30_03625 [Vagococcus entomophilus]